ncbi:hypothetical protein EBZ39_04110 [bacterium]|nr:hypothetical protein [bacterium]
MSQESKLRKQFGSLFTESFSVPKSTVQQTSSITAGVTINSPAGSIITNTTGNVATSGSANITVTNSAIDANSIVIGRISGYSGSGFPVSYVNNITTGSFQVHIKNFHGTNAVSGGFKYDFYTI